MEGNNNDDEVAPVTFMSYNSTGINSVKCKWICDICDEFDVDYLAIQEHFKKTQTIDKYFRDNFRGYNSYVIPGYSSPGQDSGRCKAGLAQLSKKVYYVKKDRVTTRGFRIQTQVLNMPTCRLLWMNTYMPTDPKRLTEYDDSDLQEVLLEVETILSCCNYTDVIWAGDLNWDMSRVTYFSRTMATLLKNWDLSLCGPATQ
jgi:exonuclease III